MGAIRQEHIGKGALVLFADHQGLNASVNLRKHLGLFGERHLLGSLDGGKIKHPQHMEVVFVESKRSLSRSARCPTYMPDSSSTPLKTHTAFRPGRNH